MSCSCYCRVFVLFFLMISMVCNGQGLVKEGNYLYTDLPKGEGADASGKPKLIPFQKGLLTDGKSEMGQGVYWGGGENESEVVQVMFDLLKDRSLSKIRITNRPQNQYWGVFKVSLAVRSEKDKNYRVAGQVQWSVPVTEFNLNHQKVRYVKLTLQRYHRYEILPLEEVEFFEEDAKAPAASLPAASIEYLKEELKKEPMMVDRYGQYLGENWPGKVSSDAQLVQERKNEEIQLENVQLDLTKYDKYGGILSGGQLKATGFFRTEKVDGRWWLVTPEGHKFLMKGVCSLAYDEWGYTTPIVRTDKTPRNAFMDLPSRKEFPEAYLDKTSDGPRINFVIANLKRKYGPDFESKWRQIIQKRLLAWGFNACGKWEKQSGLLLPYTTVLDSVPADRIRSMRIDDPFDPRFLPSLEEGLKDQLLKMKDDPWLVGHTYDNENGWDYSEILPIVLKAGSESPAKRALAAFLVDRYKGNYEKLNADLKIKVHSVEELAKIPLNSDQIKSEDRLDFMRYASREYYRKLAMAIKKYDPNHLFIGSSLVPGWRSCSEWEIGGAEYLDGISLDIYGTTPSNYEVYRKTDKPIFILEYSFSVVGRGLAGCPASLVPDQKSRGLYYRNYVEQSSANPQLVGFSWFICYDSPVTMRNFPFGENFNQGLLDVCDQPYIEMLNEMKKTNARLYDVHAGIIPPVNKKELGIK